jgi:hypothetical protein
LRLRDLFKPFSNVDGSLVGERIPNDAMYSGFGNKYSALAYTLGFMLGGIAFGSIHIVGWNLKFPMPTEQLLWRISSILMTAIAPAVFIPMMLLALVPGGSIFFIPVRIWFVVLGVLYIAARLFILVEIFRTLLYLPPDAYVSTWASNVPHVA